MIEEFGIQPLSAAKARAMSPVSLAFVGDGVHTLYVRSVLASDSTAKSGELHKRTSSFVKAESQASGINKIMDSLSEEEVYIFKRGRNAKTSNTAKNASMIEYKTATGFEALVGYLYLTGQNKRLLELFSLMEKENENG